MTLSPSTLILFVSSLVLLSRVPASAAQDSNAPIVTVIHIDAMPEFTQPAVVLLDQFRRDSLQDAGEKEFHVLQEMGHPNHFTLVEKWAGRAAYEAHNIAPHTRHFRDRIQPMLGSPFDERIHTELTGAP